MRNYRLPSCSRRICQAAAVAGVATLVTACSADTLNTGPERAVVLPARVYEPEPAISTRTGAAVPIGDAPVTEDADRIAIAATRPAPEGARVDGQAVVISPATTMPATSRPYVSDGAMSDTYDENNPPRATLDGYDSGAYPSASAAPFDYGQTYASAGGYADDSYVYRGGFTEDYWHGRSYGLASPYFYSYPRYGYGYPYSRIDGRRYDHRDSVRGDRHDPRRYDRDRNDRDRNVPDRYDRDRDREDRTPRFPYTNSDRDGNGVDDRRDDGNRPTRDAAQAYRRQQQERNDVSRPPTGPEQDVARARETAQREADFAAQQRAYGAGGRTDASHDVEQRREANREAAANRAAPSRDESPRNDSRRDASRAESTPSRAEASRRESTPARAASPRREAQPARDASPSRAETPRRAAEPARSTERSRAADRPTRDAGSARSESPPSRAERNANAGRSNSGPTRDAGSARSGSDSRSSGNSGRSSGGARSR